jgi:hypothetical protein
MLYQAGSNNGTTGSTSQSEYLLMPWCGLVVLLAVPAMAPLARISITPNELLRVPVGITILLSTRRERRGFAQYPALERTLESVVPFMRHQGTGVPVSTTSGAVQLLFRGWLFPLSFSWRVASLGNMCAASSLELCM